MTREMLIKHWDVIQAFKEGKVIQYLTELREWVDEENPSFGCNYNFRIKPERQLVPFTFEDAEFLIGKVLKMKEGITKNPAFTLVTSAGYRGVALGGSSDKVIPYDALFQQCTFLDGSPCGKLAETSNK